MSGCLPLPGHIEHLGLTRHPFPPTPDADCYYCSAKIEQHRVEMLHCIESGKGFMLLTGEVGTGKSTFLRTLMDTLGERPCAIAFVFNTFLQERDLLLAINRDFGLSAGADLAEDIGRLNQFLIDSQSKGTPCVLVVDDAQNLTTASLELLRLLSNLETRQNKLLQILLAGQPELLDKLALPEIRQFASRIALHVRLDAFSPSECEDYVAFRLAHAGNTANIRLSARAGRLLHRLSRGNPRRIHFIMDRCLYGVIDRSDREIPGSVLRKAASEAPLRAHRVRRDWRPIVAGLATCVGLGAAGVAWTRIAPPDLPPAVSAPTVLPQGADSREMAPRPASPTTAPEVARDTGETCLSRLGLAFDAETLLAATSPLQRLEVVRQAERLGVAIHWLESAPVAPFPADDDCVVGSGKHWIVAWRDGQGTLRLAPGQRGQAIEVLQQQLASLGYYAEPIDGIVGQQTLTAFRAFQIDAALPPSRLVSPWTRWLLAHADAARPNTLTSQDHHAD